jgi:DNA-binding cell septation regulator SpoVG
MKIAQMNKGEWGKVVAFFDLETSEGLILKGFKVVDSDGLFVGFPSVKDKEGKYNRTINCPKEVSQVINKLAVDFYNGYTPEVVNDIEQQAVSDAPDYANKDEVIPF